MGNPNELLQSGLGRYLGMIGTDLIYLWLIGLMHRIINKRIRDLPVKYWILIITIPIISIFLLQTILDGFTANHSYNYISLGLSLVGIVFINIAMFNFFESYEDKIKLKYLETMKHQEQENYKLLTLSYNQVSEFKHDIENQFLVLNDMLENNDTDSAKKYLVKLSSFVRLANRLCYTGSNAVDSIVNIKGSLAQTYGIEFICKVNIITSIKADELELCRIIGNGLDNAIEGCLRADTPHKHIWISLTEEREKLFLVITNTSDKVNPSDLSSTKKDKGIHGIGINSIRSSVDRLGGLINLDYEDGIFKLNIMIHNCLQI
jgi:sensor histidine kinase YesM